MPGWEVVVWVVAGVITLPFALFALGMIVWLVICLFAIIF